KEAFTDIVDAVQMLDGSQIRLRQRMVSLFWFSQLEDAEKNDAADSDNFEELEIHPNESELQQEDVDIVNSSSPTNKRRKVAAPSRPPSPAEPSNQKSV